jgi:hypothetical protein
MFPEKTLDRFETLQLQLRLTAVRPTITRVPTRDLANRWQQFSMWRRELAPWQGWLVVRAFQPLHSTRPALWQATIAAPLSCADSGQLRLSDDASLAYSTPKTHLWRQKLQATAARFAPELMVGGRGAGKGVSTPRGSKGPNHSWNCGRAYVTAAQAAPVRIHLTALAAAAAASAKQFVP